MIWRGPRAVRGERPRVAESWLLSRGPTRGARAACCSRRDLGSGEIRFT